jgi:hypothetical protein
MFWQLLRDTFRVFRYSCTDAQDLSPLVLDGMAQVMCLSKFSPGFGQGRIEDVSLLTVDDLRPLTAAHCGRFFSSALAASFSRLGVWSWLC